MSALASVTLVLVVGYLALLLFVYLMQDNMLYYPGLPSRDIQQTPADIGLAYEDVELRTSDDVRLHGWYVPGGNGAEVVLFFHGNAGNISHRLDSLRIFHELGVAVLIFDYRGYGRSGGRTTEVGTYRDADAAWRYLVEQRGYAAGQIVLFGRSLGAAVASRLATQAQPGGLILESAFVSVPDMAARIYPFLPVRWLSRYRYDTAAALQSVTCPVLVIHSPDDDIIPYEQGERLFVAARDPKRFVAIAGDHNTGFLLSGQRYVAALRDYLAWARSVSGRP